MQNCTVQWSLSSEREYADPFNEVEISAIVTDPRRKRDGRSRILGRWQLLGHTLFVTQDRKTLLETSCSDETNADPHERQEILEVTPYHGDNPLYQHGSLRVSQDLTYLKHRDGTPFVWLGDTSWMGSRSGLPGRTTFIR